MGLTPTEEAAIISQAMVILGRKGGLAKSARKKATAKQNGKLGGRPRKSKQENGK